MTNNKGNRKFRVTDIDSVQCNVVSVGALRTIYKFRGILRKFDQFKLLGQDPCPCAFYIVDMVPYTISKLSAKSQFCAIQTADNTDGKVRIEIILLLENNKMLPGKIKTEKK